jgi:4'-phosphopantetheinyl transferase
MRLAKDEIHIWSADLDLNASRLEFLSGLLSADEQDRAGRFRFWRDQRRYMAGRGILRLLIGRYHSVDPKATKFLYSKYGKPYLPSGNLKFNVAHCQDLALFGFCFNADIGVDVECIRTIEDAPGIASRFFSPGENEAFLAAPVERQTEVFLSYWTLKEAYVKALGLGLSYPLDNFEVSIPENEEPLILADHGNNEGAANWSLFSLSPQPGCAAAVAAHGNNWRLIVQKFAS